MNKILFNRNIHHQSLRLFKRYHHEGRTLKSSYEYIKVEIKGKDSFCDLN